MASKVSLTGNTIEFKVVLNDFGGSVMDPDSLSFLWYTDTFTLVSTTPVDLSAAKVSTGTYTIYFTPNAAGNFIYEILCVKDSLPSIYRDRIRVVNVVPDAVH